MRILISPAHYYFTDKHVSEPRYAFCLVKYIGLKLKKLDVIVGINDTTEVLPPGIRIVSIYKSRNQNPVIEFAKYLLFYPLVCLTYFKLHTQYDIVHHLLPTSPHTVDPLLLLVKITSPKTKIIIGPLQMLSQIKSPQGLNLMLVGKSSNSFTTPILPYVFNGLVAIAKPLSRLCFSCADTIVCSFEIIKKHYQPNFPKQTIITMPFGVDPIKSQKVFLKKTDITIISVGYLMAHKGHQYLLEAFASLSQKYHRLKLVIIGEGELKDQYQKFIIEHKLQKRAILTGHLSHKQVEVWYDKASIFCLPSLLDTNPIVVMEAMSKSLPVVASNVGAVPEVVANAGLIVPMANSQKLSAALEKLVSSAPLRRTLGNNGLARIKKLYTWDVIADRWIKFYESLANNH
jgi:glycosyltransferase involved in cell wall biosynthesis